MPTSVTAPPASRRASLAGRWLPPLALMALIFALSAREDLDSGLAIDFVARKIGHASIYGLLWWLLLRATRFRRPWLAALAAVAYAISDEYHQTFVPTRHGTPLDVGIDTAGVAVAALLLRCRASRRDDPPSA